MQSRAKIAFRACGWDGEALVDVREEGRTEGRDEVAEVSQSKGRMVMFEVPFSAPVSDFCFWELRRFCSAFDCFWVFAGAFIAGRLSLMFCRSSFITYSWSVVTYCSTFGAVVSARRPDIPAPSSRTVDSGPRTAVVKSGFSGDEIHSAKRGVIFHTTAPVVPPGKEEERRLGDWAIITS